MIVFGALGKYLLCIFDIAVPHYTAKPEAEIQ